MHVRTVDHCALREKRGTEGKMRGREERKERPRQKKRREKRRHGEMPSQALNKDMRRQSEIQISDYRSTY